MSAASVRDARFATDMAPDTGAAAASAEGAGAIDVFRREVGRGATAFLSKSDARAAAARGAAKALFAKLSSSLAADGLDLPLPELHTDGLDAEQVWMQIEMQLEPLLGKAKGALRRLRPAISAGDELTAERLLRLPANAQGEASGSDEEAPEWEPFEDGVEYDMDGEERDEEGEEDDDEEEEEEEEDPGGSPGKRKDLTSKLFENPGMFNLTEMENFALQAEAEEEARLEREERREQHRKARESGDGGGDDSESESEENALDAEDDEEDDSGSDASGSGSEDDDDVADLVGDAARLAGVERLPRTRAAKLGAREATKKKGKDLMFSDFFGDGKAPSGAEPRRSALDEDEDEASDGEEDLFAAMERGEMESKEEGSESDEEDDMDALDQRDEDALREELERELADELAAEGADADKTPAGGFGGGFDDDDETEGGGPSSDADDADDDGAAAAAAALASRRDYAPSAFQRAQDALARQIKTLEARALDEKTWLLKGEASAKERPKNSVLEADVEFDHVAAPPPAVSEEMTARLEDVIKARVAEQRFDDVERVEPATRDDRGRRQLTELDDQKSKKGLGEIYADDYAAQKHLAKTGARLDEEKEDPVVVEARALFSALAVKLDALSNFHFAPKPAVQEMAIKTDAPALQAEEVAPLAASGASRAAPEEVFAGGEGAGGVRGSAAGDVKADAELSKEDRKAARAKRKRKAKAVGNERERVRTKREREKEAKEKAAEDAGFTRKAPKVAMLAAAPAGGRSKSEFSKSSKVFGMLQEAKEADALGRGKPKKSDGMKNKASLKL